MRGEAGRRLNGARVTRFTRMNKRERDVCSRWTLPRNTKSRDDDDDDDKENRAWRLDEGERERNRVLQESTRVCCKNYRLHGGILSRVENGGKVFNSSGLRILLPCGGPLLGMRKLKILISINR